MRSVSTGEWLMATCPGGEASVLRLPESHCCNSTHDSHQGKKKDAPKGVLLAHAPWGARFRLELVSQAQAEEAADCASLVQRSVVRGLCAGIAVGRYVERWLAIQHV